MIKLRPYKENCKVAKILERRLRHNRSDLVINWGGSDPIHTNSRVLNKPEAIRTSVDKLSCLNKLKESRVRTVPFTTSRSEANAWDFIVSRTLLRSSQGRGIVLTNHLERLPDAPLYTKYLGDDRREYRVHVFMGEVIDYQKRVRVLPNADIQVRSHNKGWDLARHGFERIDSVATLAIKACEALGLDFGAVDIVRDYSDKNYVLEVNSAPNLNKDGRDVYVTAITHKFQ